MTYFQALSAIKSDESLATTTTADDNSSSNRRLFSSEFLRDVYGAKLLQQLEHADGECYYTGLVWKASARLSE